MKTTQETEIIKQFNMMDSTLFQEEETFFLTANYHNFSLVKCGMSFHTEAELQESKRIKYSSILPHPY